MKLFELFLTEYQLTDVSRGTIYRGYVNASTGEVIAQQGSDLELPHVDIVARNPDKFNVPQSMREEIPTGKREYFDWIIDNDQFGGPWQQVAYRSHWVRYSIWGRTDFEIGLSGYAQDVADVFSSSFILTGVKTAIYKEKGVRVYVDVVQPGSKNVYGGFSDHFNGMTGYNGMKRRFAEKYGAKLIEHMMV